MSALILRMPPRLIHTGLKREAGTPFTDALPPKAPEMVLNPDERNVPPPPDVPNIPAGLLAPTPPGGPVVGGAGPAALTSTGGPSPVMQPGIRDFLDRLDSWLPSALRRQPGNVL